MNRPDAIEILRHVVNAGASWVLFENGTAVFLASREGDLQSAAIAVLREYGQVEIGAPAGDFNVIPLGEEIGWGVTFEHPDLLTLVLPSEINAQPSDLMIGLLGRNKRGDDAAQLKIVHVQSSESIR